MQIPLKDSGWNPLLPDVEVGLSYGSTRKFLLIDNGLASHSQWQVLVEVLSGKPRVLVWTNEDDEDGDPSYTIELEK